MTARVIAASLVALAIAGCGGSSASMNRLRAEAARICAQALAQGTRIQPPAVPAGTAAFLRRGIATLRPELAALRELRTPPGQAGAYSAALDSLSRELGVLTSTAHDLDRGADPLPTIKTLQHSLAPLEADGSAAWRTLGVPECGNR
jgi:hypothetical protein